jgi:hypothetical protein
MSSRQRLAPPAAVLELEVTGALRLRRYSIPPCESPRTRDRHRAKTQHARGWKAPHNNSGREHTNRRPNNRRDRRSGSVPQRCGIRKLYRCCSSPSSVREEAIFRQTRHSTGKRPPQTRPLDARLGRHPPQSLAAYLLPTPPQRRQTSQGRHHCRYAQTAHCDLQCCQTSNAICSASSCYVDLTAPDQPYADRGNRGHAKRSAEFS